MTREEAIRTLKEHKIRFQHDFGWDTSTLEALDMAIKALEQDPDAIHNEREQAYMKGFEDASKRYRKEPCEDCISREAVHDLIAHLLSDYLHDEDRLKIENLDILVEDLPPVTPKPKMGHWVKISPAGIYECSECGQNVMTGDIDAYRHCHGCGAKMAESEE